MLSFRAIAGGGRRLSIALMISAILTVTGLTAVRAFPQSVQRVESVGFTVSDMDKAIDFYTGVLPFKKESDKEILGEEIERLSGVFGARVRVVRLRLGDEILELTEYLNSTGRPIPADSRSNDRWFQHIAIIVSDMDKAFEVLHRNKVRFVSTAPQTLPKSIPNAAGIRAFYFKDPDHHVLEILQFPEGKGAPKWHGPAGKGNLFLGIDHTAIVVGKTPDSLRFYQDTLGLTIAGTSENFGTEQEHLNNVFGARLHITGLRTELDGIAVEFLDYLAPGDGRPFPADTRSNDLWHWQTSFEARVVDFLSANLLKNGFGFVSPGVVRTDGNIFDYRSALLVRDADGHAVRIIQR